MKDLSKKGYNYELEVQEGLNVYEFPNYITFVHKNSDGQLVSGITSEELLKVLIDRHEKLSKVSNEKENISICDILKIALDLQEQIINSHKS